MKFKLFGIADKHKYILWGGLTMLMGVVAGVFKINDFITSPQHEHWEHFQQVSEVIRQSGSITLYAYYLFFLVNLLWAYTSLVIIDKGVRELTKTIYPSKKKGLRTKAYINPKPKRRSVVFIYRIFAVSAFVLNLIEALQYVVFNNVGLPYIVMGKKLMFSVCLLFFIGYVFEKFFHKRYRTIARFIGTSFFSLLFIGLVYILLTLMAQGGTLVVAMVNSGANLFLLFFLLIFFAIILAHYPTYFEIWWFGNNKIMRLRKARFFPLKRKPEHYKTWDDICTMGLEQMQSGTKTISTKDVITEPKGLGVIYYDTSHATPEAKKRYDNEDIKRWRRSLGILIYVAFFNIFLGVFSGYFEYDLDVVGITLVILAIALYRYHWEGERYNRWRESLKAAASNDHDASDASSIALTIKEVYQYTRRFPLFLLISFLSSVATSILGWTVGWSIATLIAIFITLILHTYLYIYFKICRTFLKYVFFSERLYNRNPKMFDVRYVYLFNKYQAIVPRAYRTILFCFGSLSNNIVFIISMSVSGLLSLLLVVLSNVFFEFAAAINPINIIVLYIIVIYGIFFVLFKIVLYYNRNATGLRSNYFKRFGIPIVSVILIGWMAVATSFNSDLHELSLLPITAEKDISAKAFLQKLQQSDKATTGSNYFYIGSYGGGLKANLWNTLLFFELDSLSRKRFFHKTVAMSGVSGGAVGIGNYAASRFNAEEDAIMMRKHIEDVAQSNVLSYELTFLLGWDFIRELIPVNKFKGTDRSYYSMRSHARLTGFADDQFNTMTYRGYWQKMYAASSASFPILLTNTTSTQGKQGVASSLKLPDSIFSGADNILDFQGRNKDKSLSYYGAISTTNRFPLFSPTAEIPSKGHYLDGGYFDNSGLLSALELHEYLAYLAETDPEIESLNPVFINIINSKSYYISRKIKEWKIQRAPGDPGVGELSAIVETIASIDKFPRYVSAKIKNRKFILEDIFMPHKIHFADITAQFKGAVADPLELIQKIEAHNDSIDTALEAYAKYDKEKWGVVEPPLARLLSLPAVRYQEAMVKYHPDVRNALERILGYLKEEKEVKIEDQQRLKYNLRRPVSVDLKKQGFTPL